MKIFKYIFIYIRIFFSCFLINKNLYKNQLNKNFFAKKVFKKTHINAIKNNSLQAFKKNLLKHTLKKRGKKEEKNEQ